MGHNHGNEYQVKIIHADGTEEFSAWVSGKEQVSQTMAAAHRLQGASYWLRARRILCADCSDREERIIECPIAELPSPRCSPHDSRYLMAVGSRDPQEVRDRVSKRGR